MPNNRIKTLFQLLRYLKRLRLYFVINTLICIVYEALPIVNVLLLSYTIGNILAGTTINYINMFVLMLVLIIVHSVFGYLNMWTEHDIAYRLLYRMRYEIYERMEKAMPSFSNPMQRSEIASIASNDLNLMEWFYAHTVNIFITCIVIFIALSCFLYTIHPVFALITAICIVLYMLAPFLFNKRSDLDGKRLREAYGKLSNVVIDGIQGMKEIMGFNLFDKYKQRLHASISAYDKEKNVDAGRRSLESIYTIVIITVMYVLLIIFARKLYIDGILNLSWITVLMAMVGSLFAVFAKFISMSTQFSSIFAASSRVLKLLNMPINVEDTGTEEFDGNIDTIEFQNVVYSYPNSSENQIKNMSFVLNNNTKIALSGESGSGKSTIVNLLQRYADPTSGQILVNGKDIRRYTLRSWRNALSVVNQDTYLFKGSVMENIRMGKPDASMDEIIKAAQTAQAHDFIMELPDGYNTQIGERALKLSGGEKQRISIARAILKGSSFIILDEAQSSLDSENEYKFNKAIKNSFHNKMLLSIAHRVASIKASDKVLFIDNGQFVAFDTYDSLASSNTLFRTKVLDIH